MNFLPEKKKKKKKNIKNIYCSKVNASKSRDENGDFDSFCSEMNHELNRV